MGRCFHPTTAGYERYGGRGITVCERWLTFDHFLADMGERPEGKTLDRIDGDGNYEPDNCRWATPSEQMANQNRAPGRGVSRTASGKWRAYVYVKGRYVGLGTWLSESDAESAVARWRATHRLVDGPVSAAC